MSQVILRDGSRFPMDRQSVLDIYSKVQKLEYNDHDAFIHLAKKCSKGVKGKFPELDEVLKEYGFFIPEKEACIAVIATPNF